MFSWGGLHWSTHLVWIRLYWFGAALALVLLASSVFDRFATSQRHFSSYRRMKAGRALPEAYPEPDREMTVASAGGVSHQNLRLTGFQLAAPARFRPAALLRSELSLMLEGRRWWWYVVMVGLITASLTFPLQDAHRFVLPLAWLWPVLVWSQMGTREIRHQTRNIVFSAPHPLRNQLSITWAAGAVISLLVGSGVAVRMLRQPQMLPLLAWLVAALSIPSFALACGTWTGNGKLFEAIYITWWYAGPLNQLPHLDFMFTSSGPVSTGTVAGYASGAILSLTMAFLGRKRLLSC